MTTAIHRQDERRRRTSAFRAISGAAVALSFWLLAPGTARGVAASPQANTAQTVDLESIGPKIGEALPDFNLRDQGGQLHSLKPLLGSKGAVIVFFRSADW